LSQDAMLSTCRSRGTSPLATMLESLKLTWKEMETQVFLLNRVEIGPTKWLEFGGHGNC